FTEKRDVFFPRERHQNAHPLSSATIEKPARRQRIDSNNVKTSIAQKRQIGLYPFRPADVISIRIRFERTVRDAFDEKLPFAFEKELRLRADSQGFVLCHVEVLSVILSATKNLESFPILSQQNNNQRWFASLNM